MKKILSVLMALVLVSLILPAAAEDAGEDFKGVTLNVFNWGSYIDEEETVLRNFEKKYNCKINYQNYDSNETLYTKLLGGDDPWDILVPSDYMIERLIKEKRLQPRRGMRRKSRQNSVPRQGRRQKKSRGPEQPLP